MPYHSFETRAECRRDLDMGDALPHGANCGDVHARILRMKA